MHDRKIKYVYISKKYYFSIYKILFLLAQVMQKLFLHPSFCFASPLLSSSRTSLFQLSISEMVFFLVFFTALISQFISCHSLLLHVCPISFQCSFYSTMCIYLCLFINPHAHFSIMFRKTSTNNLFMALCVGCIVCLIFVAVIQCVCSISTSL